MQQSLLFLSIFLSSMVSVETIEYRAYLEPIDHTLLSSDVDSTVMTISRRMGEAFKRGDELLTLDDTIFSANYTRATSLVAKAEADLDAKRKLFNDKVVTRVELREAEAALASAQADLVLAKKGYESCYILAPYTGKVMNVYVKQYERVTAGQKLIEILNDSVLIAKFLLPEMLLPKMVIGETLQLKIVETGSHHTAKIVRIGAIIDPVSSLFKVDAEIDNIDGKLRSGMQAMFTLDKVVTP